MDVTVSMLRSTSSNSLIARFSTPGVNMILTCRGTQLHMISNSYVIPVNASPQLELVQVGLNPITQIAFEATAIQIIVFAILGAVCELFLVRIPSPFPT